jgi:prevent-host-death family protein
MLTKDYIRFKFSINQTSCKQREITMKLTEHIKPISYLKAHAAEIFTTLADQQEPMVITQNGEAKVVIQDIASYEQTQQTMALLKILALGNQQISNGDVQPAASVFAHLRDKQGR